jgi:AcrR family transcriptional regulator
MTYDKALPTTLAEPAPAEPGPAGSPGDSATPDRILEAATELFGSHGFARTTIRQIAERARANSALIYYYFGSKTGLLEALMNGMQTAVHGNLERALASEGTARAKLERFIRLQADLLRSRSPLLRILMREVLNHNDLATTVVRKAMEPNLGIVTGLIRDGIASGEFRPVDPVLAARTLVGSLLVPVVLAPHVLGDDDPERAARLPDHVVDLYLKGDLDLESLITNRVKLDEVNDAFEAMERQEGIRTVITF